MGDALLGRLQKQQDIWLFNFNTRNEFEGGKKEKTTIHNKTRPNAAPSLYEAAYDQR